MDNLLHDDIDANEATEEPINVIIDVVPVEETDADEIEMIQCLNCEKEATMEEDGQDGNVFCGKECQDIFRRPHKVCQLVDVRHAIHTMKGLRTKVTPNFMFCIVTETDGEMTMDSEFKHMIRVEVGHLIVRIYDRNRNVSATYNLSPSSLSLIIIPSDIAYTMSVPSAETTSQIAKVSIILTQ